MDSHKGAAFRDPEIDELIERADRIFLDTRDALRERDLLTRQFEELHAELMAMIESSKQLATRFRAQLVDSRRVIE